MSRAFFTTVELECGHFTSAMRSAESYWKGSRYCGRCVTDEDSNPSRKVVRDVTEQAVGYALARFAAAVRGMDGYSYDAIEALCKEWVPEVFKAWVFIPSRSAESRVLNSGEPACELVEAKEKL